MKKITLIIFLFSYIPAVFAQDISGTWYGQFNVQSQKLNIIFHIIKSDANYQGTMDIPSQGAKGLAAKSTSFEGNNLTIDLPTYGIKYVGQYRADSNKIKGTFIQGDRKLSLDLSRVEPIGPSIQQKKRPQDPINFPYEHEEVRFVNRNGGDTLAGTLTYPTDRKFSKVAILITGCRQNRDEELLNHRPFLVLSDWLTRNGIAVLRYDDRGVGKSTGDFFKATTADFTDDAESAVTYLLSRQDTQNKEIGLIGHSEGGLIAPMIASRNKHIGFVIMLEGAGVPMSKVVLKQSDEQLQFKHVAPVIAEISHNLLAQLIDYENKNPTLSDEQLKPVLTKIITDALSKYPPPPLSADSVKGKVDRYLATVLNPWYRHLIAIDPSVYLTKVHCPLLAINGTLDVQVSEKENLNAIRQDMIKTHNKHFTIVPLKGLNHMMQKAITGSMDEYGVIEETINPIALNTITQWISQLK